MTQRRMARPSLGGLMATRQGALALALVCAVCAAGILVFALGRYRSNLKTQATQATVLVATAEIPQGTSGAAVASRSLYKAMPITSTQLAPGAISDASLLTGKVASASILPGQQLTLADFSGVSGVSGTLAPNMRAISISVGAANGDSAVVTAGDRIDIYNLMTALSKSTDGTPTTTVFLLASNIQVLKAPGAAGGVMVLAVTAQQAPQIDWAVSNGSLYMSLRPVNATVSPTTPTTLQSVLTASNGGAYSSTTGGLDSQDNDGDSK